MMSSGNEATKPSFTYRDEEKEEFVSHMMAGVELMVKPVEEAVLAKSQEILNSQEQLQSVVESEENRFVEAKIKIAEIQQIMMKVPQYKQKLLQVRKEMGNIQRRCNKLSSKSEQLRGVRNKIRREEELEAEKLAKLEARVVSTTRPPKSGGASPVGGAKVAVVNE